MAFALSGSTITQTGTDTDISGLEAIAGVTTTTIGNRKEYDLGSLGLSIEGTLTLDPDIECIVSSKTANGAIITIEFSGELKFGTETTGNGNTRYSAGVGLKALGATTTSDENRRAWDTEVHGAIHVEGGKLTCRGGIILSARSIGFARYNSTNPEVDIVNLKIVKVNTDERREFRFNEPSGSVDTTVEGTVVNLINDGFQITHRELPSISATLVNGEFSHLNKGAELVELENIDASQNINGYTDMAADSQNSSSPQVAHNYIVTNSATGSGLRFLPKAGFTNRQLGYLRVQKAVRFNISDHAGAAIHGAVVFMRDTDNNYRVNSNGLDATSDFTYFGSTNSSGVHDVTVTTAITNIRANSSDSLLTSDSSGYWDSTLYNSHYKVDRRGLDDTQNDRFTFHIWAYNYLPAIVTESLRGLNRLDINWTLFADTNVTATATAAAAYSDRFEVHNNRIVVTADATLDELYDYAKYEKTLQSKIEHPSASAYIATASGTVLDIGALNLVINTGVTLSTGDKFRSVRTTGTATITGTTAVSIIDSTGVIATLITSQPATSVLVESVSGGSTTQTFHTTDADGIMRIKVDADSMIKTTAKKWGYKFRRSTHDLTTGLLFDITLEQDPNVDIGQNVLTAPYFPESHSIPGNKWKFYFDYVAGGKSKVYVGSNATSQGNILRAISALDNRLSDEDGLRFLHNFNSDDSITALDGLPYRFYSDRLAINEDHLEFVRIPGTAVEDKAYFACPVYLKDTTTPYTAPVSEGDDVRFFTLSTIVTTTSTTIANAAALVMQNSSVLTAIGNKVRDTTVYDDRSVGDLLEDLDEKSAHVATKADVDGGQSHVNLTGISISDGITGDLVTAARGGKIGLEVSHAEPDYIVIGIPNNVDDLTEAVIAFFTDDYVTAGSDRVQLRVWCVQDNTGAYDTAPTGRTRFEDTTDLVLGEIGDAATFENKLWKLEPGRQWNRLIIAVAPETTGITGTMIIDNINVIVPRAAVLAGELADIRAKTDKLMFVGDDVKSTLDGELNEIPIKGLDGTIATNSEVASIAAGGEEEFRVHYPNPLYLLFDLENIIPPNQAEIILDVGSGSFTGGTDSFYLSVYALLDTATAPTDKPGAAGLQNADRIHHETIAYSESGFTGGRRTMVIDRRANRILVVVSSSGTFASGYIDIHLGGIYLRRDRIQSLLRYEEGRRRVHNFKKIIYDDDGTTHVLEKNLKDGSGNIVGDVNNTLEEDQA